MGQDIEAEDIAALNQTEFSRRLTEQLSELKAIMGTETFGRDQLSIGAELELYLIDQQGEVSTNNLAVLKHLDDSLFQPEINQYNLELNLPPLLLADRPFTRLHQSIKRHCRDLDAVTSLMGLESVPIGILPTLKETHLGKSFMTDKARYHLLSKQLFEARGEPFHIAINGEEAIRLSTDSVSMEGANTSFQVHMMVPPERLTQVFNAAQLSLPLVTAVAANSPIFLGHSLWDETRIALFKQSLDCRIREKTQWQQPTRVFFGHGWLQHSAWELFAQAVALYEPILPCLSRPQSSDSGLPLLSELNLHMGTIWPWHRPVYCPEGNGHVRIEFRAIPAGPSHVDMVANAMFAIGLANGLADDIEHLTACLPFKFAEYNFYRAAQHGLDAKILWPLIDDYRPEEANLHDVLIEMLPVARRGLIALGIDDDEIDTYLGVIEHRIETRINGAIWQRNTLNYMRTLTADNDDACHKMLALYCKNLAADTPVSQWGQPWR